MEPPSIYARSENSGRLRQGEIVSNLIQLHLKLETIDDEDPTFLETVHPYALVLTQDCELESDYRERTDQALETSLPNILFCEAIEAAQLRGRVPGADIWKRVKSNKDERYQFLTKVSSDKDALERGIPELGLDFKRCFTIPAAEVYLRLGKNEFRRRCRLVTPYAEHLSTRFFHYQCRIALPAEHVSE